MNKNICVLLGLLFFSSNVFSFELCSKYIASGAKGLGYFNVASEISTLASEKICALESTGSIENIGKLTNSPNVFAGIVQSDIAKMLAVKHADKLQVLLPLLNEALHLFVRSDTNYKRFIDLADKVVCIGSVTSGSNFSAKQVMALSSVSWVEANETFSTCLTLLDDRAIDAVFIVSSVPIKSIANDFGNKYRLIPIPKISDYKQTTIQYNGISTESLLVQSLLLVRDEYLQSNRTIANKLVSGVASYLSKYKALDKDEICMGKGMVYALSKSSLIKDVCRLGYWGQDW